MTKNNISISLTSNGNTNDDDDDDSDFFTDSEDDEATEIQGPKKVRMSIDKGPRMGNKRFQDARLSMSIDGG
jgi:hypothetical protein